MTTPSGRLSNEPGEKERKRKNAIYSGHLRLCQQPRAAHALRSDQFPIYVNSWVHIDLVQVSQGLWDSLGHHILPNYLTESAK